MALNSNHTFEELDGIKCSIVEKQCSAERASFLKNLLQINGLHVVIVKFIPKASAKKIVKEQDDSAASTVVETQEPEFFTVGVSDVTFSPVNAVFNRELKDQQGNVVTSSYWNQENSSTDKDEWYWTSCN